ncbi:MAG TPA: helix-turn-helix transcriptional regulator [Pyrinomonadaceae bacterium]|nr:helix-turn-helix transcriptional regulator [Pyrinomonadaceae bacterium]
MPASQKLKALRKVRNITVREVEQASRRIAEARGDKRFCISNGWLTQLENGVSEPSICKLFSLSVIYHVKFSDLIRLYDVDIDETEKYEPVANPNLTQLFSQETDKYDHAARIPSGTSLLPGTVGLSSSPLAQIRDRAASITRGYIGMDDFTMYPLIRPGSTVRIDIAQNKLKHIAWHSEYERPIYFIELRDAFACGWCELHGNQLLIIPHHSSPASIQRFTYPKEAEIVGRVTSFETRCVDEGEVIHEEKTVRAKSTGR